MKITSIFSIFAFLVVLCAPVVKCDEEEIEFSKLARQLPIALSDMAATYIADFKDEGNEAIILTGGCSDENGNAQSIEEIDGKNVTSYYCNTISKEAYVFYPSTFNLLKLADMPFARYRHSAAFVDGKLYVIGGRTLDAPTYDELAKEIHVYDPKDGENGSWKLFMTLTDEHTVSDQTSFARGGSIYILGGYQGNGDGYTTRDELISLNVETKEILSLASMITKRGDASAAYYNSGGIEAIYIMGGFTSKTNFCEPLSEAEKYDFATNKWTTISPLVQERGDKGVVVLNDHILAIGGEDKHESICAGTDEGVDPSSHAIAVNDVESFNPQDGDDAKWEVEVDFNEFRFRSAAAVAKNLDTVFLFGGQMAFSDECNCYKTSKDIFYYREKHSHPNSSSGRKISIAIAIVASLVTLFIV